MRWTDEKWIAREMARCEAEVTLARALEAQVAAELRKATLHRAHREAVLAWAQEAVRVGAGPETAELRQKSAAVEVVFREVLLAEKQITQALDRVRLAHAAANLAVDRLNSYEKLVRYAV